MRNPRSIMRNLIKPELAGRQDPHIILKSFVGPLSYMLGVGAGWISIHAAFVIYMITPLFFIVPPRWDGVVPPESKLGGPRD